MKQREADAWDILDKGLTYLWWAIRESIDPAFTHGHLPLGQRTLCGRDVVVGDENLARDLRAANRGALNVAIMRSTPLEDLNIYKTNTRS